MDKSELEQLLEQRKTLIDEAAAAIEKREGERAEFEKVGEPSDEQRSAHVGAEDAFGEDFTRRQDEINTLDRRIDEEELKDRRRQEAARASQSPSMSVTSEPLTYRKDNAHEVSYFADLAARFHSSFASRHDNPSAAQERLERHAKEMDVELPKREQAREARALQQIDRAEVEFTGSLRGVHPRGLEASPFEKRVNPNRTDGQGGFFVPPLWRVDEYIRLLRAGRVAADLCRGMELPPGTDSINVPKVSTGTLTGVQTADAAPVTSQDLADTSVSASVKTIAGQEDVAIQLLEQSPGRIMDQVIMEDLTADYNKQLDAQVLLGTGLSGQITGLLPVTNYTGSNTVTWTTANPAGFAFNQAVGAAVSQTAYSRYSLDGVKVLTHPRRWFWFATSGDTVGGASPTNVRPLVNTADVGFNIPAREVDPAPEQGRVGHFPFGVDAYIDGNMPVLATAAGAITGGTSDLGLVAKWDDIWLFEGELRTRVLPEILSGTLQVRFQCFAYYALLVRYGQSIAVIQGTGMAAPKGSDTSIAY